MSYSAGFVLWYFYGSGGDAVGSLNVGPFLKSEELVISSVYVPMLSGTGYFVRGFVSSLVRFCPPP